MVPRMSNAGPRVRRLAHPDADVRSRALGLSRARPALVLLGPAEVTGTELADTELAAAVLPVLRAVLAAAAERDAVVVTAGADTGLAHLVGLAAEALDGRWPRLVGVAPSGKVTEEAEPASGEVRLNANHDTAVLVPGSHWGEEVPALFRVVDAVARTRRPALAVLVGGGDGVRAALVDHLGRGRALLVLAGTGGLADEIAGGKPARADASGAHADSLRVGAKAGAEAGPYKRAGEREQAGGVRVGDDADAETGAHERADDREQSADDLAVLVRSGRVAVVHLDEGPDRVVAVLHRVLGAKPGAAIRAGVAPVEVWPALRFRKPEPHPVIDPGYVLDYPLLADAIHEANQVVAPILHEQEAAALRERERARLLVVAAIAAGFAATASGALQIWLRDEPWPGVLLAVAGAGAAVLAVLARNGENPEAKARAERLRALYFDHLAAPPAADDVERAERSRELATEVARHRHEPVSRS